MSQCGITGWGVQRIGGSGATSLSGTGSPSWPDELGDREHEQVHRHEGGGCDGHEDETVPHRSSLPWSPDPKGGDFSGRSTWVGHRGIYHRSIRLRC